MERRRRRGQSPSTVRRWLCVGLLLDLLAEDHPFRLPNVITGLLTVVPKEFVPWRPSHHTLNVVRRLRISHGLTLLLVQGDSCGHSHGPKGAHLGTRRRRCNGTGC